MFRIAGNCFIFSGDRRVWDWIPETVAQQRDHRACLALSRINHEREVFAVVCADGPGAWRSASFRLPDTGCMPRLKKNSPAHRKEAGGDGDFFVCQ